jgi:uncharacterized protein (TIGR02271 family)
MSMTEANNTAMTDNFAGRTLTAFFDERSDADEAVDRLVENGIPIARITTIAGNAAGTAAATDNRGFFEKMKDFFFPDEDRYAYAEGLSRGGYLVTVTELTRDEYDMALEILDDEGAVDFDQRQSAWRSEGWKGYEGANAEDAAPMSAAAAEATSRTGAVIPVVQEDLRVGKRDVNLGRVRVRSYLREEPVSETVRLHEERVVVDRRPVDRAANGTDAFVDKTIEAEEHAEEAVVSKDARVVEEVSLRTEGEDREETITDTVRHTEVEVDDQRDQSQAQRLKKNATRR